jgi:hypothetical protein
VNLSVLIVISEVEEPIRSAPAPNVIDPAAATVPAITVFPLDAAIVNLFVFTATFPLAASVVTDAAPVGVATPSQSIRVVCVQSAEAEISLAHQVKITSVS